MLSPLAPSSAISGPPDATRVVTATIQRCPQIATLPTVTTQIIRLSEDPDSTIAELERLITNDPALGVRILKLANSAYYGMSRRISSIERAVALLGFKAVRNVAVAATLVKLFRGGHAGGSFDAEELWTHSLAVATGARILAERTRLVNCDEAFLAGLIHDAGILVELQAFGRDFHRMIEEVAGDSGLSFRQAERAAFGATHEEFGEGLCQSWSFPAPLRFVTGYHHRPWVLDDDHRSLPTLVHVADVLAARLGLGYTRTVESMVIEPELLSRLSLTESELDELTTPLPEMVAEAARPFSADD